MATFPDSPPASDKIYDAFSWLKRFYAWLAQVPAPYTPNPQLLVDGSFEIWQSNPNLTSFTSLAAASGYTGPDMWSYFSGANFTQYSIYRVAGRGGMGVGPNAVRYHRGVLGTDVTQQWLIHDTETQHSLPLAGQIVTLSFWARRGATYSAANNQFTVSIIDGTGTNQARRSGAYTNQATTAQTFQNLTTNWTKFVVSRIVSSAATQVGLIFNWTPVGTAGATDYLEIDDVKLELGVVATPMVPYNFHELLAQVQRHYQKSFLVGTTPAQNIGVNTGEAAMPAITAGATAQRGPFFPFPFIMRTSPTIVYFNPSAANALARDVQVPGDCTAPSGFISDRGFQFTTTGNAGTAIGNTLRVHWTADARI